MKRHGSRKGKEVRQRKYIKKTWKWRYAVTHVVGEKSGEYCKTVTDCNKGAYLTLDWKIWEQSFGLHTVCDEEADLNSQISL